MSVPSGNQLGGHTPPDQPAGRPRTLEERQRPSSWRLPDGRWVPITGKALAIMDFVASIAEELNASDFGTLTFDCAQKSGKPKFLRTYPEIKW